METNKGQFHCLLFSHALFAMICIISYFFVPRHNCKNRYDYFRSLVVLWLFKKGEMQKSYESESGQCFQKRHNLQDCRRSWMVFSNIYSTLETFL